MLKRLTPKALPLRNAFFITLVLVSFAAIYLLFIRPSPYMGLVIKEADSDKLLWGAVVEPGDWFHHEYEHSVERSTVIEKFRVDEYGQIYAMESWTRSFGAGLPFEAKGIVELKDGFFIMREINEQTEMIHMQPSHGFPHTFHVKDYEVNLSVAPFSRNHIIIKVDNLTWYQWWKIQSIQNDSSR